MCWHNWSKWEETNRGDILIDGHKVGECIIQERKCEKCNKIEIDSQRTYV